VSADADVKAFMRRAKYAQERQEQWWRQRIADLVPKLKREQLGALVDALGIEERPPASWLSAREKKLRDLESDIEQTERDLENARRELAEAEAAR
jgi:hypothetical protein